MVKLRILNFILVEAKQEFIAYLRLFLRETKFNDCGRMLLNSMYLFVSWVDILLRGTQII